MKIKPKADRTGTVLLEFSPWILAIACFLLLLLLTIFGVSNYQREKNLVVDALGQKGLTLLRFINSSVRSSILESLRSSQQPIRWEDYVQEAMEQAVEQNGVDSVLLIDFSGNILVSAGRNESVKKLDKKTLQFAHQLEKSSPGQFVFRRIERGKGVKGKIQIAAWYMLPGSYGRFSDFFKKRAGRSHQMMHGENRSRFRMVRQKIQRLLQVRPIYIVQLDSAQFNSPLKRQLLQIIILSIVALLVGLGGALSYITLKGLKSTEIHLGKIRAFTDILVSSLPVGLIATDESGVIRVYNSSAREFLDFDGDVILGKMPESCLPREFVQMFCGKDKRGEDGSQIEICIQHIENKEKNLELACVAIPDSDGDFAGEVMLIRDMTSLKKLERDLQKSERLAALGKMAAGVAHELRNPLSSIKGLAVLLKSHFPKNSSDSDSADILVGEVERLNRSIGELLDYARPGKLDKEYIVIDELIDRTISLIGLDAKTYQVEIKIQNREDLIEIYGDRDKLSQVFLNIFINAIQAMGEGGLLTVNYEVVGHLVGIIIRDNGCGIEPVDLPRVFDPYYTTKPDGTGLGLALSVKIIEEHGGRLTINSVHGEYTEVQVELPCNS